MKIPTSRERAERWWATWKGPATDLSHDESSEATIIAALEAAFAETEADVLARDRWFRDRV